MSQVSLTEKLVRANANVKKLCEFFAARREWVLAADDEALAGELSEAATGVGNQLRTMIAGCGAETSEPSNPSIESLGKGTYEKARLLRFITFLRDLDAWFAAQTEEPSGRKAVAALQEMEAHVRCMVTLFNNTTTAPDQPSSGASTDPGASASGGMAAELGGMPQQLVLDDTEERPLIQEFQKIQELTPECEKLADGFLEAWGIEFSYYNRKKFLERILTWISSAPEGHVLVIKMKTAEEPYVPYPSYINRAVLEGKEPPKVE